MRKDIKDLKKFKGNEHGGLYGLFPIDRKKTVKDIPKLEQHEVNVIAKFFRNAGSKVTAFRVVLCRVDELPDFNGDDQGNFIIDKIRNAKENMVKEDKLSKTGGERTVSDLINDYILSDKISKKKDAWTIQQILKFWDKELGSIILEELTAAEITSVKKLLKDKAPKTQNNYVSALCSCFNYGVKNLHWITANVVKEVAKEEVDNKIERFLSDDERVRFLEGLEKSESPTLKVFGHFGLATGCRKSEALGLTWEDIDFNNDTITFNSAKRRTECTGSENGQLKFNRNVVQSGLKNGSNAKVISMKNLGPLRGLLLEHKLKATSEFVFPQDPRTSFETLLRNCKIDNFRFHDLRHTCASYLVQAGVELLKVAAHLGHKNIQSTLRYAHLSPKVTEETGEAVAARIYGGMA